MILFTKTEAQARALHEPNYTIRKSRKKDQNSEPLYMVWHEKADHYVEFDTYYDEENRAWQRPLDGSMRAKP